MSTKIIMDVDTGTDDAVAIMTAALSPDIDLLGITTVNGNCPVEICTENTLRVVDHIGLSGTNPLSGPNDERIGPRYPNMIHAYDRIWSDKIEQAGRLMDMHLQKAVYACVKHPSSTPAEQHMLSYLG
ncbi:MAG: nucleoside hydrolase, partial [Chloroflexota bacterium]|nr:nucleoside hydrolase [Chloroflexota bacterium]